MKKITALLLVVLITLLGCDSDESSRGDKSSPGYAATMYFDAIYNKKDFDAAIKIATPRMGRIMRSYGTAKQFARNLINLQYDSVTIEVDMTNQSLREQYGDDAKVNLVFTGMLRGEQVDDMRSVQMVRKKGKWYVDKINPDPFAR
ncbi:hypothetical protein [Pseudoalteromonas phenolica]|uniref:DUF4878 domain-containing protein n=1 Tax=Pseudoalteromonas phenolica TaxID=161398 RepID=A0A0S2K1T3_9GAMM|nr:hypothetical protein [Pseudoalteromonas phenolica]ALO41922.1 hypothetical protein PP2015_1417 [Pseudoalteromonas phenolica]MBE0353515.1 hypothetical protein [Pseudoalteromonas phenolica O-BC30]RXE94892.1 hypothetical protein D9981_17300 [Pseudoalteromonas phenolica O-BC30]TMO55336.1 hypothetical protein CWC21_11670 [Pseudoalteromonas phenolica]